MSPTTASCQIESSEGTALLHAREEESRGRRGSSNGDCWSIIDNKSGRNEKAHRGRYKSIILWSFCGFLVGVLLMFSLNNNTKSSRNRRKETRNHDNNDDYHNNNHNHVSPSSEKYDYVQGFGFQIYTGGAPAFIESNNESSSTSSNKTIINPECFGLNTFGHADNDDGGMLACYLDTDDGVEKRMTIMNDAVNRAYEQSSKQNDTLKLFIAPEFFWRGRDGAYSMTEDEDVNNGICGPVCQILDGLEKIVANKKFEDWIFVFGTVIASDDIPLSKKEKKTMTNNIDTNIKRDSLFFNFAPVYKGYDPSKTDHKGKRFLVPKRYVSNMDFLTPVRHMVAANGDIEEVIDSYNPSRDTMLRNPYIFNQKRYNNEMWLEYKKELTNLGYAIIEYSWMKIDNITFTIEICVDHMNSRALDTYLADKMTGSHTLIPTSGGGRGRDDDDGNVAITYESIPSHQAQISIVSSAGMTAERGSLVLNNKGTLFLQDGMENTTSRMFWGCEDDEPCQENYQFEGGTEAVQRTAVLTETEILFEYKMIEPMSKYSVYYGDTQKWKDAANGVFTTTSYEPKIIVYNPIPIVKDFKE